MYKHAVLPTVDLLSGLVYNYVKVVRKIYASTYQPIYVTRTIMEIQQMLCLLATCFRVL